MYPKTVELTEDSNGMPKIDMRHADGALASVYKHGGHVASWKTPDLRERIFMSSHSLFQPGSPIRGGIPVVFPQFSDNGPLPKHGLVRTMNWELMDQGETTEGEPFCSLLTGSDSETKTLWPHDFDLKLDVVLGSKSLTLNTVVRNKGKTAFEFSIAFHTYFSVADIRKTGITGLEGTTFIDSLSDGRQDTEKNSVISFQSETDRIYINAPDKITFSDNVAGLEIVKNNMKDVVVWNPWTEKAARLEDFGDDEYMQMVCVETGNIKNRINLDKAKEWRGSTSFTPLHKS